MPEDLIKEYLCSKTEMYFYTNPFEVPGTDGEGGSYLDMKCNVFTLWDDLDQKNQTVIHYSMDKDIKMRDRFGSIYNL